MPTSRTLAAIDIGTSSVHLAIARPVEGGRPEIIDQEKMPVRLGSGGEQSIDMKVLDPEAMDRTIDALRRFSALAAAHDAELYAVATSAVREAEDSRTFIERARDEAGVDVNVISGVEEARLIHLGALGAKPISDRVHLVIDIGGGSTELIVGTGTEPQILRSLKIGHVRLTDRFFPNGQVTEEAIDRCRSSIRSFLARVAPLIRLAYVEVVIGCSGTFTTVGRLASNLLAESGGKEGQHEISRSAVSQVVANISEIRLAGNAEIPGVDAHRQDTILAGALLVETLMYELDFTTYEVSPDALREGLILDRINHRSPGGDALHHLSRIRANSVDNVAARYGENVVHCRQATDIALRIFDATHELHQLSEDDRDVLEAGSMLHNIGRFVGHGGHHKHSYYLIRNSEHLAGFTEQERLLIALVARYHRKSAPKPTHREFAALAPVDQRAVSILAGMLRIGIALDRTYRNVAADVAINVTPGKVEVSVIGDDLELELFAANERKSLLERSLDVEVSIVEG